MPNGALFAQDWAGQALNATDQEGGRMVLGEGFHGGNPVQGGIDP